MRQQAIDTTGQHSYHAALDELGLEWSWDPAVYGTGAAGLRAYLEKEQPHLLRAYDADFLVSAVESMRQRIASTR